MFLGIDIGSSSSKAVLLGPDGETLAQAAINLGTGSTGIEQVLADIYRSTGAAPESVLGSVVTGYGRTMYKKADTQVTEISCHAKGVVSLFPEARTVVDIGGQDAKVIRIGPDGTISDFVMNDKCAAGTGRFLEVMARVLGCGIGDLSDVAAGSGQGAPISNTCTVFAESEVISQLSLGRAREDVALGALEAVARRVSGLAARVGVAPAVVMTGGVALNQTMTRLLSRQLGHEILVPESPQTMGALGAALYAREKYMNRTGPAGP